ncbi:MAG TPA: hypothetical protein VFB06_12000 [Streptosporangiaceae bacterium]|nr:hypothetical protein [Streptosporangiaceae bacterium]
MIIVKEYSDNPVDKFPEDVQAQVKAPDEPTRAAIIALVNALIAEQSPAPDVFGTWADLLAGASRLLPASVFRPVLPAEHQVATRWRQSALSGTDFKDIRNAVSVAWAKCGQTPEVVIGRLRDNYGATISKTQALTFKKADSDGITPAMMATPGPGEVLLLECTLEGIHTFLIEVHSSGARYLIQGYQNGYSAVWWVSSCPVDLVIDQPVPPGRADMRGASGAGKDIAASYAQVVQMVVSMVRDGYDVLVSGRSAWRQLPFDPSDNAPLAYHGEVALYVNVYRFCNPQAVRDRTGVQAGALSVQGVLSLPVDPPAVDRDGVLAALAMLGLQADYSTVTDVQGRTIHRFKVTADQQGQQQALTGKILTRVGATDVTRLRQTDLPVRGQQIEIGYNQFGLEKTVTRSVQ